MTAIKSAASVASVTFTKSVAGAVSKTHYPDTVLLISEYFLIEIY